MAEEKPYNISIETKAQITELQKVLAELQSINAEIAKLNGLTFDAVSASAEELVKTGKERAGVPAGGNRQGGGRRKKDRRGIQENKNGG